MGKKRRRLDLRAQRQSQGDESPPEKRKAKLSDHVATAADGFFTSLLSSFLRAIGL